MSNEIAIKVENLSKVYRLYDKPTDRLKESIHPMRKKYHKDFYALNDVSFEVKKGETVGIIGKNGSGKSTLLKIITGVLTPSSGNVIVNGRVSALLELGAGFNPEYTGIENIYLNGTLMGYSKEEMGTKVQDIIDFADIGDFVYQPVKMYSSGMFARLAFAVAINIDPEILIVDEALSVGDAAFQAKCFRKFNEFKKNGKTILFVTHSMDTIIKYCSSGIVLNDGKKIEEGLPNKMVDVYKKLLVNCYNTSNIEQKSTTKELRDELDWKKNFQLNSNALNYGNNFAEIIDFGIFDEQDNPTTAFFNDEVVKVKMRIKFKHTVKDPIFAFTIKDVKGQELTGTNTMHEDIETGAFNPGDEAIIVFSQKIKLAGANYLLSLGCTGFVGEKFIVYHRLYDILVLQITSVKGVVGVYYCDSEVEFNKYC